eukprot:5636343-Amphidinium_carterae.1
MGSVPLPSSMHDGAIVDSSSHPRAPDAEDHGAIILSKWLPTVLRGPENIDCVYKTLKVRQIE